MDGLLPGDIIITLLQNIDCIWELDKACVTSSIKNWFTTGFKQMKSIQLTFFGDMDATMLEPHNASRSESVWVDVSMGTIHTNQEWTCWKATPPPLESEQPVLEVKTVRFVWVDYLSSFQIILVQKRFIKPRWWQKK